MADLLKQSTARNLVVLMIDSADHLTGKTGLTLTINASKNGAAFAAITPTVTELSFGVYNLALTTAHTDTLGDLMLHITGTGADATDVLYEVVAFDPADAVALGLSRLDAAISSRMATFTLPTNFSSLGIDASGRIDLGKWIGVAPAALSASGYVQAMLLRWLTDNAGGTPNALVSGRADASVGAMAAAVLTRAALAADTGFVSARSNTAQAGAASTITLDAAASATDNIYNGCLVIITGGTGIGQARVVTGYVGSTKVATVDRAWQTNPDNTSTFAVIATDLAKLDSSLQVTAASVQGNVTGNVNGSVGSVTGAVGSVTAGVTVSTNNDKTGYSLTAAERQAIWDFATSLMTTAGSIGKRIVDFLTGDVYARLGAPAGASHAADVAALKADLDAGVALTATERNATADAILDRTGIDASQADTMRKALRLLVGVAGGAVTGADTGSLVFKSTDGGKNRVSGTGDASGNRSAITYDLT